MRLITIAGRALVASVVALALAFILKDAVGAFLKGNDSKHVGSYVALSRITFRDLTGNPQRFDDSAGKVVLLDFWATSCGACKIQIPQLIALQKLFGTDRLKVIGVTLNENKGNLVQNFIRRAHVDIDGQSLRINYPIVFGSNETTIEFGVIRLPTVVVISRDGFLVDTRVGLEDVNQLAAVIDRQVSHPIKSGTEKSR